ncbi:MAG: Rpn family recombination-promoting nuclease/putative transposase [Oscillatoria sp. PMC 1068.18]|nr:Rpn family recombination-promoting nuclease/putative transposase [Oscillatoria sp. PMC 1076.18]MEC4989585.1 Rpn family recombination-promoting nuclease/putative transposase [Oscillatoria sp. PMC 1068.18]
MYDNICKFLAENYPSDIASWLLGEAIPLTQLSPTELSVEPIRADSLILLQSANLVLHAEFQTQPDAEMAFRMADYRLRVYRRFPQKAMRQVVVYLKPTGSELVYQDTFSLERLQHSFEIIRLWEQPTELFLETPGLLPFAVLSQTEATTDILQQVARRIEAIGDARVQSNLAASTSVLAGLVLEKEVIQRLLRSEIMRESVIYQEIEQQGVEKGIQQVALNMLRNQMSIEQVANLTGLSVATLERLQQQINSENEE